MPSRYVAEPVISGAGVGDGDSPGDGDEDPVGDGEAVMDGELDPFVNGWLRAGCPAKRMQGVKDED